MFPPEEPEHQADSSPHRSTYALATIRHAFEERWREQQQDFNEEHNEKSSEAGGEDGDEHDSSDDGENISENMSDYAGGGDDGDGSTEADGSAEDNDGSLLGQDLHEIAFWDEIDEDFCRRVMSSGLYIRATPFIIN